MNWLKISNKRYEMLERKPEISSSRVSEVDSKPLSDLE
nr:MAG TPA: hypothetical protein [Caudoviricetes sp.]